MAGNKLLSEGISQLANAVTIGAFGRWGFETLCIEKIKFH